MKCMVRERREREGRGRYRAGILGTTAGERAASLTSDALEAREIGLTAVISRGANLIKNKIKYCQQREI
jgi:hypothetical protein